jgi:PAS domain S-box-containing protein
MNILSKIKKIYFYVSAFVLLVLVLILYNFNNKQLHNSNAILDHTHNVISLNNNIRVDLLEMETNGRGFLITNNVQFYKSYELARKNIYVNIQNLKNALKSNLVQSKMLTLLKSLVDKRVMFFSKTLIPLKFNQLSLIEKARIVEDGRVISKAILIVIDEISKDELRLMDNSRQDSLRNASYSKLTFVLVFVLLFLVFILVIGILKGQKLRSKEAEVFNAAQNAMSRYSLSLLEASRDPLFAINPDGKITDLNEATVRVTDLPREKLIGTDFANYFTQPEQAREIYKQVFIHGFISDFPLVIKDGHLTPVLFNGSVYKNDLGVVIGAVVVARDITERKRFELELTEARVFAELATAIAEEAKLAAEKASEIASDAVRAKQQFLSNMSHEIRTPMNAIIGFTKVVLKTDLSAKQREYLSAIKMSGDALIVLINDILDLAKVDSGKMTFEETPFQMSLSIAAMLHVFETKIQEKNLELIQQYDKNIPRVLIGDAVRLHQIMLNLLSNAIKFTSAGSISVLVKLKSEDEKEVVIQFSIIDTGIGITTKKIDKIFENFHQASSSTSRLYGGTGLGLAIVKQLVEAQGGTINVVSEPAKGSNFNFTLKFLKTTDEAIVFEPITEIDAESKNISVLVVEDIALNQLLMKTLLDDFGFNREIAGNGKIAIEKLKAREFDIILMDLQMPEMNGFEATDYIRNVMHLSIPIIALTADVTTVDLAKCKLVGMNDYIAKPVDERVLYSKILSLVKKTVSSTVLTEVKVDGYEKTRCINLDYLHHRTKSNPVLMIEMINIYLEQTPLIIQTIKESLQRKDWKLLSSSLHKIIPSFAIMGINKDFETMAKAVQEFAHSQDQVSTIPELVSKIENVCIQACNELKMEIEILKLTNQY